MGKVVVIATVVTMYLLLFCAAVTLTEQMDTMGTDWCAFFHPHATNLTNLFDGTQHYPPWTFVLLYPLAVLPSVWGYVTLGLLSLALIVYYARTWWRAVLLSLSTPILITIIYGNVDVLLALAFILPLPLALVVVSCKPQMLAGWAVRKALQRKSLFTYVPMGCVALASIAVWGWWPKYLSAGLLAHGLNVAQLWPWTIIPGLLLLATRNPILWLVGSAMLSPYLQLYHLTPLLVAIYRRARPVTLVAITALSWIVALVLVG